MPIAREHRWLYPIDWRELSAFIRFGRAKGRCEHCQRPHGRHVLHLGDVYRTTSYPIIDVYNGGTLKGTIEALDLALQIAGPQTKIIPGHGLEVMNRDDVVEFRDMVLDIQGKVLALIREGKKLDEVVAARPTADYDAQWTNDPGWGPDDFVPVVYYQLGGAGRVVDQ